MSNWVRQVTTGTVTLRLGPFVDINGAALTTLTISQADVRLSKNGGDFAQKNEVTTATHDEGGWYIVTFDDTDLGTLGTLDISIQETGALPYFKSLMVTSQQVWDSFFSTDALQVHAVEMTNDLITAAAIATGAIDADSIAADAITAAKVAADVSAEIADAVWDEDIDAAHQTTNTAGKRLDDASTTVASNLDAAITTRSSHSAADAADAVWDEDIDAAHQTANTAGKRLDDSSTTVATNLDAAVSTRSTFNDTADTVLLSAATQTQIDEIHAAFSGIATPVTLTGTPTQTSVQFTGSNISQSADVHIKQALLLTSGAPGVIGLMKPITDYSWAAGIGTATFTAPNVWDIAPSGTETGFLIGFVG